MSSTCGRDPRLPASSAKVTPRTSGCNRLHYLLFPKELHVNAFPAQPFSRCKCVCKAIAMASSLPLPIPPRTPTPPSDEAGDHYAAQIPSQVAIDRDALSPLRDTFPRTMPLDSGNPDRLSPTRSSFVLSSSPTDTAPAVQNGSSDSTAAGPFNFNTTVMAKGPVVKSVCLQWTGDFCKPILIC